MPNPCTVCQHPDIAQINGRLLDESPNAVARDLGLTVAAVYRHVQGRHHRPKPDPSATTADTKLVAQISRSLRQAESVLKVAFKHLKATAVGSDPKATNGAITAAKSMLELISELRGDLQRGVKVNVGVSIEQREAMDSHAAAQALTPSETIDAARSLLGAHVEAGDAHAIAAVLDLMRSVPGAEVEPDRQA